MKSFKLLLLLFTLFIAWPLVAMNHGQADKGRGHKDACNPVGVRDECLICLEEVRDILHHDMANLLRQMACCRQLICSKCLNDLNEKNIRVCPGCRTESVPLKANFAVVAEVEKKKIDAQESLGNKNKSNEASSLIITEGQANTIGVEESLEDNRKGGSVQRHNPHAYINDFYEYDEYRKGDFFDRKCRMRPINRCFYHAQIRFDQPITRAISDSFMRFVSRYDNQIIESDRNLNNLIQHQIEIDTFMNREEMLRWLELNMNREEMQKLLSCGFIS